MYCALFISNILLCLDSGFPCPNDKVNPQNRENANTTEGVASWAACSELCRQRDGCSHWTWANENAGQWALECVTMTGYGYTNNDTNVVSGTRDCGGKGKL